ncbi:MAG: radical SAM protein, partial [Candidatus Altiarchaeota archaeon]
VVSSPSQNFVEDLDGLPFPAYHRVDLSKYGYCTVVTSRGCPYNCTFCELPEMWGSQNRARSIDNVIEEINLLKEKYGVDRIMFVDDTFVLSKKRVFEFCDKLEEEKIDLRWGAYGRVNLMDGELMRRMSGAGCYHIFYGVESGSDRILKLIKKDFTVKQSLNVISKSMDYFEEVIASLIWGFPFEIMSDFNKTLLSARYLDYIGVNYAISLLSPLPLNHIFRKYGGKISYDDAVHYSKNYELNMWDEKINEIIKKHPKIFSAFYYYDQKNIFEKKRIIDKFCGSGISFMRFLARE